MATDLREDVSPHDRKASYELALVLAALLVTIVLSILSGQDLYILGYIVTIVYALYGPIRRHRPWQDLGLKRGFVNDFWRVWYYFGIDAILFQILPPILGIAFVFGYYAKTHNLALTWATHYVADVVGLIALVLIF